jgi:hypothetical protein
MRNLFKSLIDVLLHIISIEDAYEALIVFEVLTIEKKPFILSLQTHVTMLENLGSSSIIRFIKYYALFT